MRKSVKDRLISKVRVSEQSGCWDWASGKDPDGYGRFSIGYKALRAHRVSYEIHCGPIPDGIQVLHSCDNPGCVNPAHLFLGTNDDNVADKVAKGRQGGLPGESHPSAKLTDDDVRAIRSARDILKTIADKYQISRSLASQIRREERWTHI